MVSGIVVAAGVVSISVVCGAVVAASVVGCMVVVAVVVVVVGGASVVVKSGTGYKQNTTSNHKLKLVKLHDINIE